MFAINLGIKSVETVHLYGWVDPMQEKDINPARAALFGHLLDRSVTEHFKSDFFHDATWLKLCMVPTRKPFEFLWVTRLWGTHIGPPSNESAAYYGWQQERVSSDPHRAFFVRVWNDAAEFNGAWQATFVEVAA